MNFKKKKEPKIDNKGKHLLWFAIIFFLILLLLVVRLFWIQFVDASTLKEKAYKQSTSNIVISPKRGTIYDSTGKALAVSSDVDTISINPSLIAVKNDSEATNALKEKVAKAFSDIFGLDYDETLVKVTSTNSIETIAKKVDADKVAELKQWMKDNDCYSGINIDEDTKRSYPYSNLASNLIGFCGSDNNGLAGIEYYWDKTLTGTPGKLVTSTDVTQESIPDTDEKYIAPENGSNITLSIDVNIQSIVEKYLKQAVEENDCKNGGSMILMDPSTGDILAMATYPDYNLNTPFEPNEALLATWDTMTSEEKTNSLYKMYSNKVVNESYEPGSVFKIILAAIGLEENIVETDTAGDFYCSGSEQVADRTISCAKASGHGSQSLRNALENSCNPALIQLGQRIGIDTLYKYFSAFGLFEKTGIAVAGESSSQFHTISSVGPTELATMSFGQRFTITPLQMITAASAIANDGVLVKPRIVTKIENPDTGAITNIEVEEVRQVISSETAAKVRNMMESVVTDGGGQSGAVAGYSVGGKTGTSEPDPNHPEDGYVAS
ncbi:MAG: peptidoglycan D,D-transpeptidase FtsI family protein, partial [Clostridia bacterium]